MKLKLSLILLVFFSGFGFAQETKTVSGTIVDQNDVPLSGAQIKKYFLSQILMEIFPWKMLKLVMFFKLPSWALRHKA